MIDLGFSVEHVEQLDHKYDSVLIVGEGFEKDTYPSFCGVYLDFIEECIKIDESIKTTLSSHCVKDKEVKYLVVSPTGPLNRDYDDARRFEEAAKVGITKLLKAGKRAPALIIQHAVKFSSSSRYKDASLVAVLGACESLYVPIEKRECNTKSKIDRLGVATLQYCEKEQVDEFINNVIGIEVGRIVTRDIGGSDPERMSPPNVVTYLKDMFSKTGIKMDVISGHETFVKDYPLFAAVNRAAKDIPRHDGKVIYLEYAGEDVNKTFLLVGKGVTYDTGGADVKAGGVMAGMHRDKCGAATVAGIFATLHHLKPKGVKVVGRLAMVRNSIGSDSYVADEIITSAAGVRVRVGNTDAEGRMAMSDPLYHSKEQALKEVNPHLMTIATLTGHSIIAVGDKYSIFLDNGPARQQRFAEGLQSIGEPLANPVEVSTLRREDYAMVAARNEYEDVLQCNNLPSSRTPRGHQFPAAFMIRASGLDKHGIDSEKPLRYTHVDIAGSSGHYPGIPTAAPLVALTKLMNAF